MKPPTRSYSEGGVLVPDWSPVFLILGFPNGASGKESAWQWRRRKRRGKESACNAGDTGSIPELGRSPGEGNGYPLQYSCLENPMDRGAWWATVHRIAKIWTQLKCLSMHTPCPGLPCVLCPWVETGSFCFQLALSTICCLMSERD